MCIAISDDATVVGGYGDGFARAFVITNKKFSPLSWELVNAHKGALTSIHSVEIY
jgi:hypothetical protein